jgi:hypothetical protein
MKKKIEKEPKHPIKEIVVEPKKTNKSKVKEPDFKEETLPAEKTKKQGKVKAEKAPKVKKEKRVKNREKFTVKYFKKFSGRHADSFDDMVATDYKNAIERATTLLSINSNDYEAPYIITVPDSFSNKKKVFYRLDKKEDGTHTLIYDQALLTILFFGSDSLFHYQANVDHTNGRIGFDKTGEFNYFDVVHMETVLNYDHLEKPKYIMLDLIIGLVDGTKIALHLRNHRIHDTYELPSLLTETESRILDVLKHKVRESRSV